MLLVLLPMSVIGLKLFEPIISKKFGSNKLYIALCFLLIVFFIGFRSAYVGSMDTQMYFKIFERATHTSNLVDFLNFCEVEIDKYLLQEGNFYSFVWLISRITHNVHIFLVIITLIIVVCVFNFIVYHSEDFTVSCILYICLGLMTFNMNGMRQSIAMSICLLAYGFATKKRFVPFLLTVLFAMTFHISAVVFLPVYLLCAFSEIHFSTLLIFGVLFIAFSSKIAMLYDSIASKDYASADSMESGGFVIIAIYLLVLAMILLFRKKFEPESKINSVFALCFVGFVIYSTRYFSTQIFERISYYYYYFIVLAIPKLSRIFDLKSRTAFNLIIYLLSIALFAYRISATNMIGYKFFF